jgi:hypothetical protein
MKKIFAFAVTMLLGASLAFAQTGAGSTDAGKSGASTKTKKHHHNKGGKKSKKGSASTSGGSTTPK